jgi:hypothetical protein
MVVHQEFTNMENRHVNHSKWRSARIEISVFMERELCVTLKFWLIILMLTILLNLFNQI